MLAGKLLICDRDRKWYAAVERLPASAGVRMITLAEFVAHYHRERNHQGLGNQLIDLLPPQRAGGPIRRRQRVGGLLSYYYRAAA